MNKVKTLLFFTFDSLLIAIYTFGVSYLANRAGYTVFNGDGYAHATKIKFLVDFWPNINWVYFWGNGIPVFLWYALMPYAFLVGFFKLLGSAALAINAINILTFIMIGIGIYGTVREVTRSRFASLIAAFLVIPMPGLWYRVLVGTTPRTFGDGFLALSVWFLVRALREAQEKTLKPTTFLGLAIFTALAFQTHFFTVLVLGLFNLIIILVVPQGLGNKIKWLFFTFVPATLLSLYFLGPFLLTQNQSQAASSFGLFKADPLNLQLLLYHPPDQTIVIGGGLMPIHLPLLGLLLVIALIWGKFKGEDFARRITLAFGLLFMAFFLFGVSIYLGYPPTWFNTGFVPDEAFEFLSLIIPVLIGVLWWLVASKFLYKVLSMGLLLVIMNVVFWQYPILYPLREKIEDKYDAHYAIGDLPKTTWALLAGQENERNYRFAHPATELSLWFNFESKIPQNREFFPHGVLYPNWRSWQENAIWNPKWDERMGETKFLMDWYSLRWFLMTNGFNLNKEKYLNDPDFDLKVDDGGLMGWEFKRATPILSATNVPSVLIIGDQSQDRAYSPLVHNLAILNLNSQVLIPVRGKSRSLDDYSLAELAKFPLISLYEYHLKNPDKAGKLLMDYMNGGGSVLVESSGFISENDKRDFEKTLGFVSSQRKIAGDNWDFFASESDLTKEIDFTKFSPPSYEGSPWKVSGIDKESLGNKEPILLVGDKVVIFRQQIGKGEIVWSGLNLPYHVLYNQNLEEAKFLNGIVLNLLKTSAEPKPALQSRVTFVNPQKRTVEVVDQTNAILFKENYFFNWHAVLDKGGKKTDLQVYPAGLDFMYIPLGADISSGIVTIYYEKSWLEKGTMLISIFFFLALIAFILFIPRTGNRVLQNLTKLNKKSLGKISTWWQKDNEE